MQCFGHVFGIFESEMCLVAWWMWPGQLLVPGSNWALPNTLQNLQNSKIKIPSPRPPFGELKNIYNILLSPIKHSQKFKSISGA